MNHFRQCDRDTAFLLPPSVDEWLPEDHLARFVVDIVDQLDLSGLTRQYRGAGSAAYHPSMLVALLLYGYATGTYSSRRIEQASYESLAFRYIAANTHPDHDTLCTFRKRFLKGNRGAVCAGAQHSPGDEAGEAGDGGPGWDEGACQRLAPQRAVLWACREARGAVASGGEGVAGACRSGRCRAAA